MSWRDVVCAPFISLWSLNAQKTSWSHKRDTPLLLPDFLELETSAWLTGTYLHVQRIPLPLVGWLESKYGHSLCHRNIGKGSHISTGSSPGLTAVNLIPYRLMWFFSFLCGARNKTRCQYIHNSWGWHWGSLIIFSKSTCGQCTQLEATSPQALGHMQPLLPLVQVSRLQTSRNEVSWIQIKVLHF